VLGKDEEGEEWKRRPLIVASLGSMLCCLFRRCLLEVLKIGVYGMLKKREDSERGGTGGNGSPGVP